MKAIAKSAAAALLVGWAVLAHATDYTARLVLDGGLPPLRFSSPEFNGPHSLDGDWASLSERTASARARDQVGIDEAGLASWDGWRGSPGLHNSSGPPPTLGETIARSYALDYYGSGSAEVYLYGLSATGRAKAGNGSELNMSAEWRRGFSLGAGVTMSFATLCTLSILGDALPLEAATWFNIDATNSFASLTMADLGNRVSASLFASITSAYGGSLSDVFSYRLGDGGSFVLSITNPTDNVMTGWMNAGTYVDVSAPIPEPGTVVLLALGVAVVSVSARRSRRRA
ncbi:PEP-CTERM sorting domain-containing protein [Rhizobacter sp. LjRoot28]|uniref:PEP-CTERM sorting domain-containing protein n=1 Tax=Rhizobacter sp. LjRoot28 TaxID=3342309 RepID=UPI003ED15845